MWLWTKRVVRAPGLFALYVAGYSGFRIFEETQRIDFSNHFLGERVNFWIASCLCVAGLASFVIIQRGSVGPRLCAGGAGAAGLDGPGWPRGQAPGAPAGRAAATRGRDRARQRAAVRPRPSAARDPPQSGRRRHHVSAAAEAGRRVVASDRRYSDAMGGVGVRRSAGRGDRDRRLQLCVDMARGRAGAGVAGHGLGRRGLARRALPNNYLGLALTYQGATALGRLRRHSQPTRCSCS